MRYLVLFICFIPILFAEPLTRCPSVAEIQRGEFSNWLPLTIEGEELASEAAVQAFKTHVQAWQRAEWSAQFLEYAHCFYEGDDAIVMQLTFAHDAFRPESKPQWVWQSGKRQAICRESVEACHYLF